MMTGLAYLYSTVMMTGVAYLYRWHHDARLQAPDGTRSDEAHNDAWAPVQVTVALRARHRPTVPMAVGATETDR